MDSSASRIHASFVRILLDVPLPQFFVILHGIAGATDVSQLLTRVLDGFFEFRILRVDEIDPSQFFVTGMYPAPDIHEHLRYTNGYGKLRTSSRTTSTTWSTLRIMARTPQSTLTCTMRSSEHAAHRLLMHSVHIALLAQGLALCVIHVIHACALVSGCLSVLSSPVSLLLPPVPIDRALHLHFSTLEKTRMNHNPVSSLILTFQRVAPLYRQEQVFQDLDIHTRSSPGLMKLKKTRTKAFLRSNFIIGRDFAVTRPSPDSC